MGDPLRGVKSIRIVPSDRLDKSFYRKCLADCVTLAQDGRILTQDGVQSWGDMAGVLNLFGMMLMGLLQGVMRLSLDIMTMLNRLWRIRKLWIMRVGRCWNLSG